MRLCLLAPLGAAVMLAGCASGDTVVILPPSDGHGVGGVVMQARGKTVVLDKPYASASPGDGQAGASKADEINKHGIRGCAGGAPDSAQDLYPEISHRQR